METQKIKSQSSKIKAKSRLQNPGSKHFGTLKFGFWICFGFWILSLGFSAEAAIPSNIEPTSLSDSSFVITWSTTDEASSTEILYGISDTSNIYTVEGTTIYHYLELSGLYPNTTYKYRIKSNDTIFPPLTSDPLEFTTLSQPTGDYLFSIAVLNDPRFAPGKANTKGARGIAYQLGDEIISSEVTDINKHDVAFTVVNGNIADDSVTYTTQIGTDLFGILENLNGASNLLSPGYKYLPVTGYDDKNATYTTASDDWMSDNFLPLTTNPSSSESRLTSIYGYTAASRSADSILNYQFSYNHYNFIFLDSLSADGNSGIASLETVNSYLSAESNSKTFIFMSFPGYNPFATETKDYPVDIPTSEVNVINISNHAAFRSTIEAYDDGSGNPIVAAVISGNLGDNYKRDINDISYVRQGQAVGYPTGYSIYKVYTNGFIKTFYKTKGRDGTDKPYYEYARDQISAEAGISASILTQAWLGSNSMRNFTTTYDFIPGLAPSVSSTSPTSGETRVLLNTPLTVTFNKRMSTDDLNNWVTISPSAGAVTASFSDSNRTILSVSHSEDFSLDTTYEVTVLASLVKDEGSTSMSSNYIFTFDTFGFTSEEGTSDEDAPTTSINPISNNTTTDPFPTFIGTATDETGILSIEYRVDSGNWISAEAMDGTFNSTVEVFKISISTGLSIGSHQISIRATDGVGNVTTSSFTSYSFSVAEDKPTITSVTIDGTTPYSGDPISSTPIIRVTVTSQNSLESGRISLKTGTFSLSFVSVDSNYYATHETASALSDGIHSITIEAFDSLGNGATYEVASLYIQSAADTTIQGVPLSYPNPFDPGTQSTTISYTLSKAANITLNLFNLGGNLIVKKSFSAGQDGGKAGYNEVSWDGKSDAGSYVGTGIYIYLIIADGKVVQNGKGKITVFNQ